MQYLLSEIIIAFECMTCMIFFEIFSNKKTDTRDRAMFLTFGLVITSVLSYMLSGYFIYKEIGIVIVVSALSYMIFKKGIWESIALTAIYQVTLCVLEFIVALILQRYIGNILEMNDNEGMIAGFVTMAVLMLMFIIVMVIRMVYRYPYSKTAEKKRVPGFLIFPIYIIVMLGYMIKYFDKIRSSGTLHMFYVIIFGMIIMNFFLYYVWDSTLRNEYIRGEKEKQEKIAKEREELYDKLAKEYRNQGEVVHELKHYITSIEEMINRSNSNDTIKNYIKDIKIEYPNMNDVVDVKNNIINIILNSKYRDAKKKGIEIFYITNCLACVNMNDADMTSLLTNIIDNAIEATNKCTDNRQIEFKLQCRGSELILREENPYSVKPEIRPDGLLSTTKDVVMQHGYGLDKVIEVVNKYSGSYTIDTDDNRFVINILFNGICVDEK